ncbi:conserved hypothetical protein [Solidesulfovibrio fructosivorans JJ]]|uniref:Peptidase U32 n=1 Tax=Solidesulfovibrio fructosivorans JJ] TaxID=596151 RepID=E1JX61_SOLFR|nr:hypothetical protein [Solidesulfovibrio fructosivorans]EFL51026.1 conserved hypothetical protein [Solidesulfovibrio fructosivorans JJ]]
MRFEVPFVPDPAYAALLAANAPAISAVYFRLGPDTPDARLPGTGEVTPQELAEGLRALPDVPRLGLLNASFHAPELLVGDGLRDLVMLLEGYLAAEAITGIVYADQYLLAALSDMSPEVAGMLTAVPSINFRLDRIERLASVLDAAADTHFRPAESVILDRDINRDAARLADVAGEAKQRYPGLRIGLMANEGCLFACPYKNAHDAHIALSRLASCPAGPDLNRDIGCLRAFFDHPERLLASPFLRPEDARRLEGAVDCLKICGRTRPAVDLAAIVRAYLEGRFDGNLLWLLDTQEVLSGRFLLQNDALPGDFFDRTNGCRHQCRECGYCGELAARLLTERELTLPRYGNGNY